MAISASLTFTRHSGTIDKVTSSLYQFMYPCVPLSDTHTVIYSHYAQDAERSRESRLPSGVGRKLISTNRNYVKQKKQQFKMYDRTRDSFFQIHITSQNRFFCFASLASAWNPCVVNYKPENVLYCTLAHSSHVMNFDLLSNEHSRLQDSSVVASHNHNGDTSADVIRSGPVSSHGCPAVHCSHSISTQEKYICRVSVTGL